MLGRAQLTDALSELSERRVRDRAGRHVVMLPVVHRTVYRPRSTRHRTDIWWPSEGDAIPQSFEGRLPTQACPDLANLQVRRMFSRGNICRRIPNTYLFLLAKLHVSCSGFTAL